jgi:thiamine biosynthesis protein ThiI
VNRVGLILLRYGEIALKGGNRHMFISRLRRNVRDCLHVHGIAGEVTSEGQRILVRTEQVEEALEPLSRVFGLVSLSPVVEAPNDIDAIAAEALRQARERGVGGEATYCVRARRSFKMLGINSLQINQRVGGAIHEALAARVDLAHPDVTVTIEVRREDTLISTRTIAAEGGLPVGSEGKVVALMSGGIDSPVAAWMMMKRGCGVIPLHFAQNPGETAKVLENVDHLRRYSYGFDLRPVVLDHAESLGPCLEGLRRIGQERWACLFCKRTMLARASQVAEELGACAIVMGDSLGQVASQTLANMEVISYGIAKPILRPLIGLDKMEIVALARRIGTYDTSVREAVACPFLPAGPVTRASVGRLKGIMRRLAALEDQLLSIKEQ